ncbi:MAG: LLM class flavin-dependent oxidoreductase, partial [Chloroflexi bacterium]|nr:LLM class flavin-dependent oxidoreductase [Chloroflexota bacterium]
MINQFGTIFAGHVDLENIGLAGTAVNDRLYSNEYLVTTFSKAEAIAKLMDEVGYDTLWLAEHHFQR